MLKFWKFLEGFMVNKQHLNVMIQSIYFNTLTKISDNKTYSKIVYSKRIKKPIPL